MFFKRLLAVWIVSLFFASNSGLAKTNETFLFYNIDSPNLDELAIDEDEVAQIFDVSFGEVAEDLPNEVRREDFYVARFPDQSYVFILNAPYNCAQLGCVTKTYVRENDALVFYGSYHPVKCENYDPDKLLCKRAGYRTYKAPPAKRQKVHFPAPKVKGAAL